MPVYGIRIGIAASGAFPESIDVAAQGEASRSTLRPGYAAEAAYPSGLRTGSGSIIMPRISQTAPAAEGSLPKSVALRG